MWVCLSKLLSKRLRLFERCFWVMTIKIMITMRTAAIILPIVTTVTKHDKCQCVWLTQWYQSKNIPFPNAFTSGCHFWHNWLSILYKSTQVCNYWAITINKYIPNVTVEYDTFPICFLIYIKAFLFPGQSCTLEMMTLK